jgi:MFS transporter, SET family, sugar efflux transporter
MSKPSSALQQTLSSPLYRGATIAMFLSGLGTSAAAPQIVLFLVKELGTPLPIAGLYYLTSLAAPLAGYLVGSRSDRTGERLSLFRLCALAGFVGWAAIALSTQLWRPFLISALILPFSVAATSQLFAAVRDDLVEFDIFGALCRRQRSNPIDLYAGWLQSGLRQKRAAH